MSLNEFAPWQCPLCGAPLAGDVSLKCARNHSFDRAKEGYWHLLPVQSMRTKAPGDSREMVAARRAFLSAGHYGIFGQALGELCLEYGQPKAGKPLRLLDAGCGEGWYDRCIAKQFEEAGRPLELAGFDIAKPAVRLAAKALPSARYAVASSFHQPVRTGWADVLLNCFSPFAQEEFLRVLRPGGVTPDQLRAVLGEVEIDKAVFKALESGEKVLSPGMKYKHYSPNAHVIIVKGDFDKFASLVAEPRSERTCAVCFDGEEDKISVPAYPYGHADSPEEQARELFDVLRHVDDEKMELAFVRFPSLDGVGMAVYNRLLRAAGFEVIEL